MPWQHWSRWSRERDRWTRNRTGCELHDKCICEYVDGFKCDQNVNFVSQFQPPNVRAVNKNGCWVLNTKGILMGPYTYKEWLAYSWKLIHEFHKIIDGKSTFDWHNLYFRDETMFYAGIYHDFVEIFLLYSQMMPTTYLQHKAYQVVHQGADLYDNVFPINKDEARQFRNVGKVFTETIPHFENCKKWGIAPDSLDLSA